MEDMPMEPMEEEPVKKGVPLIGILGGAAAVVVVVAVIVIVSKKRKAKKHQEDMDLLDGDDE